MRAPITPEQARYHYEQAIARRSPEDSAAAGAGLGALALADMVRNEQSGILEHLGMDALEHIADIEVRKKFEESFDISGKMVGYINLPSPTPEDMANAGVDYQHLSYEYRRMEGEGLEPHVVLAPHGLGEKAWRDIYSRARQDTTIPNNPLKEQSDGDGLWIGDSAATNWRSFDKAPGTSPSHGIDSGVDYSTVFWTIRLVPGTPKPQHLNESYRDIVAQSIRPQTVPEMLTDKLTSILKGETPSDEDSYSWCDNGSAAGSGSFAPDGYWDSGFGQVHVRWDGVDRRDGNLGVRVPVG